VGKASAGSKKALSNGTAWHVARKIVTADNGPKYAAMDLDCFETK